MIASGFGSSINMLFIILIVSGVLLLLLLLFYYISLAVDSWDGNASEIEEKKTDFLDEISDGKDTKNEEEQKKIIEGSKIKG